jgi:AraC-like DNA-binding protein
MAFGKEILFFFSALGAFNGLLLSLYFLFLAKKRTLAHFFLGTLLLALSLRVGKSVLFYFDRSLPEIYRQIGLSACFFIGPSLYFFLKSSLNPVKSLPDSWKTQLRILLGIIVLGGAIVPYQQYPGIWNRVWVPFIYTQWAVYVLASGVLVKNLLLKSLKTWHALSAQEKWILSVFLINVTIWGAYLWAFWGGLYISAALTFSFALYTSVFILLNRKKNHDLFSNPLRSTPRKISDEEAQMRLASLEKLMKEQKLFKNPNLKLQDLAADMNLSVHQLSQFLNDHLGKNFTHFINEYRIQEACNLLENDSLLSIEGIGDEVGFNSKSTFFSTFKKLKGVTPATYKQHSAPNL